MYTETTAAYSAGCISSVGRGAALFAGLGGVLGGLAATLAWPIVGTLFGALEGAVTGAALGVLVATALALTVRWTRSRWAARAASGVLAAAAGGAIVYSWPSGVPHVVAVAMVTIGATLGAAFGPLIAYGVEPAPAGRLAGARLVRLGVRVLASGAAFGAAAGAVTGLVIGIRAYLPTSPFAAVEGAVFGVVNGLVLACLVVGVAVLPRMRARR